MQTRISNVHGHITIYLHAYAYSHTHTVYAHTYIQPCAYYVCLSDMIFVLFDYTTLLSLTL